MPDSPDTIVRRWFKEVWDEGREDAIDALLAPHAVAYGLPGGPLHGPTAFKTLFRTFREALGDLSIEVVQRADHDAQRVGAGALARSG